MSNGPNQGKKLQWKCGNCGYTLEAPTPPDTCPSCHEQCEFLNVSCYTPDCGGPGGGGLDPQLGKKDIK